VKPFGCAALTRSSGQYLQITDLGKAITPGQATGLVFTFSQSGGGQYTINDNNTPLAVPLNVPDNPADRSPLSLSPAAG
jgi:hypothetical protein